MKCPECGADAQVIESRFRAGNKRGPAKAVAATYRRYECYNMHRFTTYEYCVADSSKHALSTVNVGLSDKALIALLTERLRK